MTRCLLLILISFSAIAKSTAALGIDSTRATDNTCTNNGSLQVFAHTDAPPLFYSIVDGPSVAALQNSGVFSSLEAGVYKVQVSDINGDSATTFVAINGGYTFPDFSLGSRAPSCSRSADGLIAITPVPGSGYGSLVWKIKDAATQQTTTLQSDTIRNLPPGAYMISATDACGNSTNKSIQVDYNYSRIQFSNSSIPKISKTGCNAVTINAELEGVGYDLFLPIQLTITTKNGTIHKAANIINVNVLEETIPNIDYGDSIHMILVNSCNDSFAALFYLPAFDFTFTPSWNYVNCAKKDAGGSFNYTSGYFNTYMKGAVDFKLYETATGMVVESGVLNNASNIRLFAHPAGKIYNIQITDGCGTTFRDTFFWKPTDSLQPPSYRVTKTGVHCLDSTAGAYIFPDNFPTTNVSCTLLSGPPYIGSTKPGFAYRDTILYNTPIPKVYGTFQISNLGPGTYKFRLYDDCGHSFIDSFSILPEEVADDNYMLKVLLGCAGENNIQLLFFSRKDTAIKTIGNTYGDIFIKNMQTGLQTQAGEFAFVTPYNNAQTINIPYLNSGDYSIQIIYKDPYAANNQQTPYLRKTCQSFTIPVSITAYSRPRIRIFNKITCRGNRVVELQADSSTGVFPLRYEIISGPATYPMQSSNIFQLSQQGNYVARVTDSCGTANTFFFTVDTSSFPPVIKTGSSCANGTTRLGYPSSPYFTYRWQRPNGNSFVGDTLTISPTTAADLGLYHITKTVSYNGCIDSVSTTYTLNPNKMHYRSDTLCPGQSLQIGTHTYTQTGNYRDTLAGAVCDSIVVTSLTVDYRHRELEQTICAGRSFALGNKQFAATGIYRDTSYTGSCPLITTLYLHVTDYARGKQIQTICAGQQYTFGNNSYTAMGIYRDTFSTAACDSISTLYLIVKDYSKGSDSATICQGRTITFGNKVLKAAGTYYDTLSTGNGCDSIVTFYLMHKPLPLRNIDTNMCSGQSMKLWGKTYANAGSYTDTLPTNECDTIFQISITLRPSPQGDTSLQYFNTEYEQPLVLAACATGDFYQWNPISCSNCASVTVSPDKELSDYSCKVSNTFGCSITCQYRVHVDGIFGRLYIPNVFSPNGDGDNDMFRIYGKAIHQNYLQIFDRWGQLIFHSNDLNTGWDGFYKGQPLPAGVYVYVLNYFSGIESTARSIKGSLTLIR